MRKSSPQREQRATESAERIVMAMGGWLKRPALHLRGKRNVAIDRKPEEKQEELEFSPRADCPGACGQFNCSLRVRRQDRPQPLANCRLGLLITRGEIARCRALPGQ
jgi:hypothetical protein